ncbi:hypothetical protein DCAR_0520342 [Daucus carota subsp. sativus]|uniref:Uncharacterized protein n=1 Tax=Daucus carota subsp. sativus TaxID=79200 RepID=A0A164YH67_DAUCS|nr:hypothetical protein DCAR_0520342 [Daucus carota subsp. sativus]
MQKLGLLRNVLKSGHLIRVGYQNPRISSLLGDSPRAFSTAGGTTTQNSPSLDPFIRNPNTGLMYGTVIGITKHTTKNDILNLLEDCNLTPEDLKVRYTPFFSPIGMLIQFPSMNVFDTAAKTLGRKGRGYRLSMTRPEIWENITSYNGKALLLQDIPRNALQDDIDRFISGCHQDGTSVKLFTRVIEKVPTRMAIVEFPSAILARLAFLTTIRKFCLNNQVLAQVLY